MWVIDIVETFGYVGVAFLVAIENLFPPIPSEIVLGLAGFVSSRGDTSVVGMILAATAGSLVGAWVLYGVAASLGPDRLNTFVRRRGRWVLLTERDVDRAEAWFDRRANLAVLVCRCVPLVRSLISLPAGLRRMPIVQFTLYTTLGSLFWNSAWVGAGYLLGEQWARVSAIASYLQYASVLVAALAILWWGWRRFLRAHSGRRPR